MVKCYAISAIKANRLYWLGRYTERVYISLHLLRRYHDKMIDSSEQDYEEYYKKLDYNNPYTDAESFRLGYMYDGANPVSLLSGITTANDNAIVLREEIKSETLSYVQLSLRHIQKAAEEKNANITNLQPITDYLLAFWGSIDERVFDERVRHLLKIGRLVENIDMHVRFDYKFHRIAEAYDDLKKCLRLEEAMCDRNILAKLDELINEKAYNESGNEYKQKLLKFINQLVLV